MSTPEHLLTIVEPTTGGDGALDIADGTLARGGKASVIMLITDDVARDIRNFAQSEDLGWNDAEDQALTQFRTFYYERTGATPVIVSSNGQLNHQLQSYVTPDVTALALPDRLLARFSVQEFTTSTGLPVIVAPSRAA